MNSLGVSETTFALLVTRIIILVSHSYHYYYCYTFSCSLIFLLTLLVPK